MRILVLHGINLNALGTRESGIYGSATLAFVDQQLQERAKALGVEVVCFQTNHEGDLVDYIHREGPSAQGALINPGAWTHYSIGLRDALAASRLPFVEVHLSNIYAREPFRHHSVLADLARGQVSGLGWRSYVVALEGLVGLLQDGA